MKSRVVNVEVYDWNEDQLREFKENFKEYAEFCSTDADWYKQAIKLLNSFVSAGVIEK